MPALKGSGARDGGAGLPDASSLSSFGAQLVEFAAWRDRVASTLRDYGVALRAALGEHPDANRCVELLLDRLGSECLSVALVAEFSRGKSELINAMFFADAGRRVVPSAAGRTTMCPTELRWDPGLPPSVRLLPIETRADPRPLESWRGEPEAWHERRFDPEDGEALARAMASVSETIELAPAQAAALGFDEADAGPRVAIPRWRHAIVNHPHPLLARGLVLIDTPGLNALGAEPDLTLRLLPEADAVLFVLAADAGVTRSDVEAWRTHVAVGERSGRGLFVVLNKIDGLWDGLRDEVTIELEIARQASGVASVLGLPAGRVYPVSAQKALVARLTADAVLERRSRIRDLERALGDELLAGRRGLLQDRLRRDFDALHRGVAEVLARRRRERVAQQLELNGLHGRNRDAISALAMQVGKERASFEGGLRQLQGLRAVLARHREALAGIVGAAVARRHLRDARTLMRASHFSSGLRQAMDAVLAAARADFDEAEGRLAETSTLLQSMYRSFGAGQGYRLGIPAPFSLRPHREALVRLARLQDQGFGALALLTHEKNLLMRRYFETFAIRLCELYERLTRDCEAWQREALAPIEMRLREQGAFLRRRSDAVNRVLEAGDSLEARMAEVASDRADIEARIATLERAARVARAGIEAAHPAGA